MAGSTELADFEVAALGFFREACVGQKEGNACFFAAVHQVGPDFGSIKMPQMGRCSAKIGRPIRICRRAGNGIAHRGTGIARWRGRSASFG